MRLLWISLIFAACLEAQTGGIAGVVVDQSGNPLSAVHVRLMTGDFSSDQIDAAYGVTSDTAGRFSVDGLKPGFYLLMATRYGYLQAPTEESPIGLGRLVLKPAQQITDYKLVLTAEAVIAGRVVDEYGDPVPHVSVQGAPVKSDHPQEEFDQFNAVTDDRGEFRLVTPPGRYYLKAQIYGHGVEEIHTDGSSGGPFVTTYYPSAAAAGSASVIQTAAGQEVAGAEIRLLRTAAGSSAQRVTVSGTVLGIPENGQATVMLRLGEKPGEWHEGRSASVNQDGKFSISGLPPGYFIVSASCSAGKTPLQTRAVSFQLEAGERTGLQLVLAPGEELGGTLEWSGSTPGEPAVNRTVRLEASEWAYGWGQESSAPTAEVAKDGSFRLTGIPPAKFRLVVDPMPDGAYIKETSLDGKSVNPRELDFTQGVGSRLKITISRAGGRISGRILNNDGDPAIGPAMVFFNDDRNTLDNEHNVLRVSDGKYSFQGLPPGKYRLFAVDVSAIMSVFTGDGNSELVLQTLFKAAEEIEVKEGDRISKDIPAWTKAPDKKEDR